MSFINDSLKKAQQAQSSDAAPAGCPPFLQMDCQAPSGHSNLPLVALMVVMMLFSVFMIRAWFRSGSSELKVRARSYDSAVNEASRPQTTSQTTPASAAPQETKPAGVSANAVSEEKPGTEGTASVAAAAGTPKPEPIVYKLQGIVFEPGHSSAVINGKTVVAGERVGEAHVVSIDKDSVTIVNAAGQTSLLDLQ